MVELPQSSSGRDIMDVVDSAARQAGAIIRASFRGHNQVKVKGRSNLVTQVDVSAEQAVLTILRAEYPGCPVLS